MEITPSARLAAMRFVYDGDAAANQEIGLRLARKAAKCELVVYSKLVIGITFHLPNVAGGAPFQIGELGEWTDLDRAILGSVLGRLSADSFLSSGFLLSAVAVSKTTRRPGEGFKALAREAGLLRSAAEDDFTLFWSNQVNKAYDWYRVHPPPPEA